MCNHETICCQYPWLIVIIIILALFEAVMKLIAMWRAARNKHLAWFICIAIINTAGILSVIYLLTHKKNSEQQ
ncbi:MAG TPA: DUF5652 family protein [Bacteroidales bacterium]|nr:DUF5652 family protein [Bacteroidales bacterium]HPI30677.1 DUF5652 family protein [Bacteroidales bacterium]HQN15579.1 DUF5652 family protein [Bacteroidales bacterium]HQP15092.1 DUF5652 family protein [Bacteroidales bacterium]